MVLKLLSFAHIVFVWEVCENVVPQSTQHEAESRILIERCKKNAMVGTSRLRVKSPILTERV